MEGQTEMGHVCIRYDSEYACKMTVGEWRPKVNIKLIAAAKAQLEKVKGRGVRVWWKHVKGHSGDKGNDRADELADQGVEEAQIDQAMADAERGSRGPGRMEAGGGDVEGPMIRTKILVKYVDFGLAEIADPPPPGGLSLIHI